MLNKTYLLTAMLITLGCSGSKGLRVVQDAAGSGGSSTLALGPDASATGGSGGTTSIGSGGAPGSGGILVESGTGGAGGSSSVATSSDASAAGGRRGTSDAAGLASGGGGGRFGTGGAGGTIGAGGAALLDAGRLDTPVAPADARDGGSGEPSGLCSVVPCLAALFLPCQPAGVCTSDDVTAPSTGKQTTTYCYPNGVKQQSTSVTNATSVTAVFTEKLGTKVCFIIEGNVALSDGRVSYVFRDGGGQQVATGTASATSDSGVVMVTCDGATPVQLSQSCMDIASSGNACNTGSCTF